MERSKKKIDALLLAFTAYMADRRPKPIARETRYNYRGRVARCIAIANAAGKSLFADDVRTLRYVLGTRSPNPSTQTGYIAALQCFYDFLISQGLRKDNPAKFIGRPPSIKYKPRPLEYSACELYEQAAIRLGLVHETVAVFGLYQGWRRSETRKAQWSWFFKADGRFWCDVTGKGSRTERVPVHPRTVELLARVRASHSDPRWLLPSPMAARAGAPISGTWMSQIHRAICREAGLPETTRLHQLRHSYATYLRKVAGADQALVQRGVRHIDSSSTEIYMEVFPEELAECQERLFYRVGDAPLTSGGSSQ